MEDKKVACIIPAAGWGSLCTCRSKVVEDTAGEAMISRVVATVKKSQVADTIVVVVGGEKNPYGAQIMEALKTAGHTDVKFAVQPQRRGAADAVWHGLSQINGHQHLIVPFADMPAWRWQTLRRLAETHLASEAAAITMVTVNPPPGDPIADYGRIARDGSGALMAIYEPYELDGKQLDGVMTVNPSLFVVNRQWFESNYANIEPKAKDNFGKEMHLSGLVPIAYRQGAKVIEVHVQDHNEARGVNRPDELERVQQILAQRGED